MGIALLAAHLRDGASSTLQTGEREAHVVRMSCGRLFQQRQDAISLNCFHIDLRQRPQWGCFLVEHDVAIAAVDL